MCYSLNVDSKKFMKSNSQVSFLKKHLFLAFALATSSQAMEFGTMGNLSASMGGAGVALKSPFGLYYNPALIASDKKTRIGYSLGVGLEQSNLDKLSNISFTKMIDTLSSVGSSLGGAKLKGRAAGGASDFNGVLVGALQGVTGSSSGNLEDLWNQYKQQHGNSNDYSQLVGAIQDGVHNSNMSQENKDIFDGFANSIDWSNFDVSNGGISSLTFKKGSNGALDEAMNNLDTLFEVLRNNNINIKSQSGIVIQLSSDTMSEQYGSVAIGIFNSMQAGVSLVGDPSKMRLIFGDNNGYFELQVTDDGYTITKSTKDDYNNYSLLASIENGNVHKIVSSAFNLIEIPIGYAYNFNLNNSNLSIGAAFKFMSGLNIYNETYLSSNLNFQFDPNNDIQTSFAFGLDLGAYYGYNLGESRQLSAGFVIKNLNSPTFRFNNAPTIVIKPQYRAGVAFNGKRVSLAFDADVLPNEVLNYSNSMKMSQMIGGGAKIDWRYLDFRAGLAYDLRQDSGVILTAGMNILGFIDIAAEVGTKWVNYFGTMGPKYASLRIGGSFSW